jgi:hypothetical protein
VREKKAAPFQRKKTETNEKYETLFQKEKRKELFQKKGEGWEEEGDTLFETSTSSLVNARSFSLSFSLSLSLSRSSEVQGYREVGSLAPL